MHFTTLKNESGWKANIYQLTLAVEWVTTLKQGSKMKSQEQSVPDFELEMPAQERSP